MNTADEFADFVEHPRFGRSPRFTKLRPGQVPLGYRLTTYISNGIIEGTAVTADLGCQSFSPIPVLYYFDLMRVCRDCSRPFIFFAEEQRHWYETLGFGLDSNCVRCTDCRRNEHRLQRQRRRWEELSHVENRSVEEHLEMANCGVNLIQEGLFHRRLTQRVRMLLNRVPKERSDESERLYNDIRQRLSSIESESAAEPHDAAE